MFVLIAHGKYAIAAKESCQMITGRADMFQAIAFTDEMSNADVINEIENALDNHSELNTIIVDFLGGTPCNSAQMFAAKHDNVKVVTGLSLAMLIQLSLGESLENAILGAKESIGSLEKLVSNESTSNELGEEED